MKNPISIALGFDQNAQEGLEFYCSVFPNSQINQSNPVVTDAMISNVHFTGINGGPMFKINPSISIMVICETQDEINHYWNKLVKEGSVLMALDSYPWSAHYGWLQDKFGVNWQLYLGKLSDVNNQKMVPTLMYCGLQQGKCKAALDFYAHVFKDFQSQGILHYSDGEMKGQIQHTQFTANDFLIMAMDSGVEQMFTFNEGVSLVISCVNQEEIDYYWNAFTEKGAESMCGWCKDPFGVSWQIIPENIGTLLAQNPKAGEALMKMRKIVITDLES